MIILMKILQNSKCIKNYIQFHVKLFDMDFTRRNFYPGFVDKICKPLRIIYMNDAVYQSKCSVVDKIL